MAYVQTAGGIYVVDQFKTNERGHGQSYCSVECGIEKGDVLDIRQLLMDCFDYGQRAGIVSRQLVIVSLKGQLCLRRLPESQKHGQKSITHNGARSDRASRRSYVSRSIFCGLSKSPP